jgi:hypothetical protein
VDGDPSLRDLLPASPVLDISRMDCDGSVTGQVTEDFFAGVACRVISAARPVRVPRPAVRRGPAPARV